MTALAKNKFFSKVNFFALEMIVDKLNIDFFLMKKVNFKKSENL